jgi:hypothetical protein
MNTLPLVIVAGRFAFHVMQKAFPGIEDDRAAVFHFGAVTWRIWPLRRLAIAWPVILPVGELHPIMESITCYRADKRMRNIQPVAVMHSPKTAYDLPTCHAAQLIIIEATTADLTVAAKSLILSIGNH